MFRRVSREWTNIGIMPVKAWVEAKLLDGSGETDQNSLAHYSTLSNRARQLFTRILFGVPMCKNTLELTELNLNPVVVGGRAPCYRSPSTPFSRVLWIRWTFSSLPRCQSPWKPAVAHGIFWSWRFWMLARKMPFVARPCNVDGLG